LKQPLIFLLLTLVVITSGCDEDPKNVEAEVKDPCITATRDFVQLDLEGLSIKDRCLRDLAIGYCNPATCTEWLSQTLPGGCEDAG
jgi:hypothetical protein